MTVATVNTLFSWTAIVGSFLGLVSVIGIYWTRKIMERPVVEIRPLEINVPNAQPEIGHDSEYELNIITKNPIAKFLLTIKMPDSTWKPEEMFSLYSETVTGDSAWYRYTRKDGYATFEIPNAAGKYHLTFGNTEPEQLTIKDISW